MTDCLWLVVWMRGLCRLDQNKCRGGERWSVIRMPVASPHVDALPGPCPGGFGLKERCSLRGPAIQHSNVLGSDDHNPCQLLLSQSLLKDGSLRVIALKSFTMLIGCQQRFVNTPNAGSVQNLALFRDCHLQAAHRQTSGGHWRC